MGAGTRALDLKRLPGFGATAWFCLALLYAPIAVLVVFSFNASRSVTVWSEFSPSWYGKAIANTGIQQAAANSLKVAVVAMLAATVVATAAALATARGQRFRGDATAYLVINLPLIVPEIVTAVATLSFFALIGLSLGLGNVMLAHTVFCIPFAYLPIRARLEGMDRTLEEAAADLYATPWHVFRRIILPLLAPGIVAGAMLAFIVSLDDYIITAMVAGAGQTTLPVYIYSQIRQGVTPEINAVSTILLMVSILFVSLSFVIGRKQR